LVGKYTTYSAIILIWPINLGNLSPLWSIHVWGLRSYAWICTGWLILDQIYLTWHTFHAFRKTNQFDWSCALKNRMLRLELNFTTSRINKYNKCAIWSEMNIGNHDWPTPLQFLTFSLANFEVIYFHCPMSKLSFLIPMQWAFKCTSNRKKIKVLIIN